MDHYISVIERIISIDTGDDVIQNGIEADDLVITTDSEWNSMDSIVAVFENGENVYSQIVSSGRVTIPWEVLQETGYLYITLVGYVGSEQRVVTKRMDENPFKVLVSGKIVGDETYPPSESSIQQAITAASEALAAAEGLETQLEGIISDLTFPIPISNGGTRATSASAALNALGITWGTSTAPSTGTPNTIYIQLL